MPGSTPSHYAPITPMTIVPAGEIDARAAALSKDGQRIAVLAQRLPLRSHKYVTWVNAGAAPRPSMRTICTPTCARSTRPSASRFSCRMFPRTSVGMRCAIG